MFEELPFNTKPFGIKDKRTTLKEAKKKTLKVFRKRKKSIDWDVDYYNKRFDRHNVEGDLRTAEKELKDVEDKIKIITSIDNSENKED